METKVLISYITSLAAILLSAWLTHYYNLKRTQFEYFLKQSLKCS